MTAPVTSLSIEQRLRTLWDADVMGIVTANFDGAIVEANDAFLRLVGYAAADIEERRLGWLQLYPADCQPVVDQFQADLVRDGRVTPRELEVLHHDGHRVPILVGAAMLDGKDGPECLAFVHDLTARKQLEAQLLQAQRLESVGLLAGGIAHDLNNVLSAILLNSECAEMQLTPDDPVRADLEEIRRAAESARSIAQQLLAFSRQQVLQPQIVELGGVCLGLEKMLKRLLGDHIQLVVEAASTRPILADLGQLEQVVLNLAVNARDAMPGGGVLSLRVADLEVPPEDPRHGLPAGSYVELRVRDHGTGMAPATLARIFEPFFTTKEKSRGTGLGLSTVFGIVKQSGGSVWAESVPDRGTTFHVVLPVAKQPLRARRLTQTTGGAGGLGETILVCDDEPTIGRILRRVLERAGYEVIVTSSPGDALLAAEASDNEIALLLSDVVMPMMSGPRLGMRLRERLPRLRALFMSGYADLSTTDPDLVFDRSAILPKPFSSVEVLARIRQALDTVE